MKLARLWDLRKVWSVQREKSQLVRRKGSGDSSRQPEELHKQLGSEWSGGTSVLARERICKTGKNKIARS